MAQTLLFKIISPIISGVLLTGIFLNGQHTTAQTTVQGSFVYDGLTRNYRLYVPAIYNSSFPVPLLLNLHGYGSNNQQQESYGDFRPIADTANFIIVHPNGTLDGSGSLYWNSFGGSTVDDVGFLSALIDTVMTAYNIDENSIYSTGMSNGGFMSYDLACSLSNRIAAIASVTGSMIPSHKNACSPVHPIPVMEIHGTADGTVPYSGSASFIHIDSLVKFWAQNNSCSLAPVVTTLPNTNTSDGCTAEHHVFNGGNLGSTVELYKIIGGGHSWPGATFNINVTNMDFKASVEIWRFFRKYKLNVLTGLSSVPESSLSFSIYPNPNNGKFKLQLTIDNPEKSGSSLRFDMQLTKGKIEIYNILGEIVYQSQYSILNTQYSIDLSAYPNGIYFIVLSQNNKIRCEKIIKN